jgi:hypothetical protein
MPMPITLKVTLKTVNGVKCLDVDDANNANHVSQSPQAQSIVWELEGEAASGSFQPLDATPPGFKFLTLTPDPWTTAFSTLARSPNGNTLTISDLNNSSNTQGTWKYQLYVSVGGHLYSTTATTKTLTSNDPTIKNN